VSRRLGGDIGRRASLALLALFSVAPLLAWVYGLGNFSHWYWCFTFPALLLLLGGAWWARRDPTRTDLVALLRAGTVGGLVGTAAYDLVRIPVEVSGTKVFAPVDSYGVLLTNAVSSSPWTGFAGWAFHTTNGVCFGIAFALLVAGRGRRTVVLGVAWAMILESVAVLSPFAGRYNLHGQYDIIAIAYAAHIPYGLAVGWAARDPQQLGERLDEITKYAATGAVVVTVVGLLLWHRPWSTSADIEAGERLAAGPSAVIRDGDFSPHWLHIAEGGCAVLRNDDDVDHRVGLDKVLVAAHASAKLCPEGVGVRRPFVDGDNSSGGFLILDPEIAP
jgi:hypothetical protein